jgi:hypothetical protein
MRSLVFEGNTWSVYEDRPSFAKRKVAQQVKPAPPPHLPAGPALDQHRPAIAVRRPTEGRAFSGFDHESS